MLLRLAEERDLASVGELTVAAYASFTLGADDPYINQLRDAASRAAQAELWVAEDEGLLLGTVTICPVGSVWREIARPDEGEFRMLAVAPQGQGRGVGTTLVRHAIDRFAGDGIEPMVLSTLPQMSAAHRLYQRLGFVRAPQRDWSPVPGVELLAFEHG